MTEPLVRIFDALDCAQQAREALLAEGFDVGDITISIANDEAGPVAGNFTVGNTPVESPHHTYARNYAASEQLAQCIMTVATGDAALASRADAILARFGARHVQDPAAARLAQP